MYYRITRKEDVEPEMEILIALDRAEGWALRLYRTITFLGEANSGSLLPLLKYFHPAVRFILSMDQITQAEFEERYVAYEAYITSRKVHNNDLTMKLFANLEYISEYNTWMTAGTQGKGKTRAFFNRKLKVIRRHNYEAFFHKTVENMDSDLFGAFTEMSSMLFRAYCKNPVDYIDIGEWNVATLDNPADWKE